MQHYEIQAIFEKSYNGQTNFMTPHVITYGKKGKYLYEISNGSLWTNDMLYGVTVLLLDGTRQKHLNKCFRHQSHVISYAKNLGKGECE